MWVGELLLGEHPGGREKRRIKLSILTLLSCSFSLSRFSVAVCRFHASLSQMLTFSTCVVCLLQMLMGLDSPSPDLAELLKLLCKIFWSATYMEIPQLLLQVWQAAITGVGRLCRRGCPWLGCLSGRGCPWSGRLGVCGTRWECRRFRCENGSMGEKRSVAARVLTATEACNPGCLRAVALGSS